MLLIHCPYCQETRPEIEFVYAGQAHIVRPADPAQASEQQWADFLYTRANPRGLHQERWRHSFGCGRYFNAVRDTVTDKFSCSYQIGEHNPVSQPEQSPEPLVKEAQ